MTDDLWDREPEGTDSPPFMDAGVDSPRSTDEVDAARLAIGEEGSPRPPEQGDAQRAVVIQHGALHLSPEQFDELVADIMDALPEDWAPLVDNMAVVVEEEPGEDDIPPGSPHDRAPLGRYRGVPGPVTLLGGGLTGPAVAAPPEIALFQGPLERASADLDDLRHLVRDTLVREIGRHFGYAGDREDAELEDRDEDELDDAVDDE